MVTRCGQGKTGNRVRQTREKLLRAAEELSASNGIGTTSVRNVNTLAEQRNTSAIRYHFDGMNGLIELRMGECDEARRQALNKLELGTSRSQISIEDYVPFSFSHWWIASIEIRPGPAGSASSHS